ncbi:MAG TPA: NAD(P)/FAD-dependent oxidoreductase [Candidatus Fimimorpha faecalis]|uniref:NAD(P)/FAD-dependent oxidoreductase n=1 Tax=Candidatus Fimimorpha faecalis TaxID=2840824 RepID=A0A9D1EG23_9FIRM|nr:NAD(P)/FAD-dependent oxidoreductase [Candidatus Fimimorpha faecalis]
MKKIIIIGGGAAGMMAAIAAAQNGCHVDLFEKNEKLGKKIYITGKGRCNVTNASDMETMLNQVVTNRKFLYSAFYRFTNEDMMKLLEQCGCPLKVERGNRVFPVSDKSSDVISALQGELKRLHVSIHLRKEVQQLLTSSDSESENVCSGIQLADGKKYYADAVIVATGGISYPSTGSTGDGYRFAKAVGHRITEQRPALVPLTVQEAWVKELQGLSLRNVEVTIFSGKKKLYQEFGEMLFTHFGVSGPAVLSASSIVGKKLEKQPLTMQIDLKPALSEEQLDARILRDFNAAKNKQFKNALGGLYPAKLIPVIIRLTEISPDKPVNEILRPERQKIISITKKLSLTLTGVRDYNEAIITQGGINIKEINPTTMESKLVSGLYFVGEVLDLDALTGGYNLQIAWSTGYAAGNSIR